LAIPSARRPALISTTGSKTSQEPSTEGS